MRDLTYPPIILTARAAFKALGLRFQMTGTEHIPRDGGALLAFNHVSYVDFVLGGFAAQPSKRLVRFMAKREIFDHRIAGPVMRSLHHINVDRSEGISSYHEGLRYLAMGEIVGIFPEATISRSFEIKAIKSGATRMAAEAGVPLIPVILWGTQRMMTKDHPRDFSRGKTIAISVGEPLHPTGANPASETDELRSAMSTILDRTIRAYPAQEQPPGSWWLPASYGGSAPTPDKARELDAAEQRARAERRRQLRAQKPADS
ncbi:MAG TPA: lysophospholipid acyltransferase family protein [Nocardioidaceae bacterium]|nr:lysophospholipid acyltransferase family protein [Nocardioidaceae bacterium]